MQNNEQGAIKTRAVKETWGADFWVSGWYRLDENEAVLESLCIFTIYKSQMLYE